MHFCRDDVEQKLRWYKKEWEVLPTPPPPPKKKGNALFTMYNEFKVNQ